MTIEEVGPDILVVRGLLPEGLTEAADACYLQLSEQFDDHSIASNSHYADPKHRPAILHVPPGEVRQGLTQAMERLCGLMMAHYGFLGVDSCTVFRFNRYDAGRGYRQHVDRSTMDSDKRLREISVVMGVNGDYEGGLVCFPRQKVKVRLGRGDVLAFPSCYTHPHEVEAVASGQRRTIVTWMK
jgi:hypothetical protein